MVEKFGTYFMNWSVLKLKETNVVRSLIHKNQVRIQRGGGGGGGGGGRGSRPPLENHKGFYRE